MRSDTVRRIGEVVGLVGVIGSLVFVGLEVRQSSLATKAATDAAVADGYRELNLVIAGSPALASAMASLGDDPASASEADQIQVLSLWRALFHIWSNSLRQHVKGTLDPAVYQGVVREISTYAGPLSSGAAINQADASHALGIGERAVHLQSGVSGVRRQHVGCGTPGEMSRIRRQPAGTLPTLNLEVRPYLRRH